MFLIKIKPLEELNFLICLKTLRKIVKLGYEGVFGDPEV